MSFGEAASRRLPEDGASSVKWQDAASPFARVAGEECVDEAALRRDDDLGNLVTKAFDPVAAAAALPPLGIATAVQP